MKKDKFSAFTWHENCTSSHSEPGLTRAAAGAKTKQYRVLVCPPRAPRLTLTMQAESKVAAKKYVKNRWPGSTVESVELVKAIKRK